MRLAFARNAGWFYRRHIRPLLPLDVQRLVKLVACLWAYRLILWIRTMSIKERLKTIRRFLRIDFHIPAGHWPYELARVCKEVASRPAHPGEVIVEAGCWEGCSSAKLSIFCQLLGYRLYIYDSFQGVEPTSQEGHDFSGEYAATEDVVRRNLARFGELPACHLFPGWFSQTLATRPVPAPIRVAYIDCDLAKGTYEVLRGILPSLCTDGVVYSQDYHIPAVRRLLEDPGTWRRLGRPRPQITYLGYCLASVVFGVRTAPPDVRRRGTR